MFHEFNAGETQSTVLAVWDWLPEVLASEKVYIRA